MTTSTDRPTKQSRRDPVRPLTEQEMDSVRQFRDWLRHPLDPVRTERLASTITTFQIAAHIARRRRTGNQAALSQPTIAALAAPIAARAEPNLKPMED